MSSHSSFVIVNGVSERPHHPSKDPSYEPGSTGSSYAHNWSVSGTGGGIRLQGRHFVDAYGRVCSLRGVNLSGCCKTPVNHTHEDFPEDPKIVTFVGRPFPLSEAHEHFARLRRWGLTFVRFLVTWEAVEHEGPGIYDQEYLAYLRDLLSLLPKYGISAFISLHQDVWSRYTGGSGAPAWTVEAVGFDLNTLEETGAAWLRGMCGGGHTQSERGLWPTGYTKLASSTLNTVFWGGDTFAPKLMVKDDIPIQQFLQNAFLNMWEVLARAVGDLEGVIGFQMLNEPHRGYIDLQSMYTFDYNTDLHLSHIPSTFQSFQLGAGYPTEVPTWTRSFPMPTKKTTHTLLNQGRKKAWREDGPTKGTCLWELHGVWGWCEAKNQAVVLRENYFVKHPISGKKIDWYTDFYYPFLKRWAQKVRTATSPDKIMFVEAIPNEFCPASWAPEHHIPNMVYAPHWYDLKSLFEKSFGDFTVNVQGLSRGMFLLKAFYWGQKGARDNFSLQIRTLAEEAYRSLANTPVFFGECGIPMDMNHGEALMNEDWFWPKRMMDAMITGFDRALVGFTLWNYNPSNTDVQGDDWNGENFSWFSQRRALPSILLSQKQDSVTLDNGGRILDAVVRPYPAKVAGIPVEFGYEMTTGEMWFSWMIPTSNEDREDQEEQLRAYETEIFFPSQLSHGRKLLLEPLNPSTGTEIAKGYKYTYDESRQTLFINPLDNTPGTKHSIKVKVWPPPKPAFEVNDFWGDWGFYLITTFVGVISVGLGIGMAIFAVWFGYV